MSSIQIPYAREYLELNLANSSINAVLQPQIHRCSGGKSEADMVLEALRRPIGSMRPSELARSAEKILVITSDHTRPVPSGITLPLLLGEIRRRNPRAEIKILIATGMHRPMTWDEMVEKFGPDLVNREEFINHNSRDAAGMVFKGIMPSGGELWLNSLVDWADLIVSEGFIEPHFFAGFSGGRKSILPGIASEKTVLANHCSVFIAHPQARTGCLDGNPVHRDMIYAAQVAGLKFILNVVVDAEKRIVKAFAGDPEAAHRTGCRFVEAEARVPAVPAEIVVTSNGGYPLDQNIYQAVKGMTAAEACVKQGGVIIMVAACNDGHGGEAFHRYFLGNDPDAVAIAIDRTDQAGTTADQWQVQILARILKKAHVIMVTRHCLPELIADFHMQHAFTLEQAMEMAEERIGLNPHVTVIPDGVAVIVDP